MYISPAAAHITPPKRVLHRYLREGSNAELLFQLSVRSNHVRGETTIKIPRKINRKLKMRYIPSPLSVRFGSVYESMPGSFLLSGVTSL